MLSNYDWENWLKGLWAAAIGGGSNAVVSAFSLNLTDPTHFNTQNPAFFKIVGTLFASSALLSFFMFLKQSPLPQVISRTTTTTTTVEKTLSPKEEPPPPNETQSLK